MMKTNSYGKTRKGNADREKGSITIFLACILLPMIIAEANIINLCALLSLKQISNDAGKMASNSALTTYNKNAHDMYGLLVFEQSMVEYKTRDTFRNNLNRYSTNNIAEITVNMMPGTTIENPEIFKGQICDAMRYNYKASELITAEELEYFATFPDSINAIDAKITYDKELNDLIEDCNDLKKEIDLFSSNEEESSEEYQELDTVRMIECCDDILTHKTTLEQKKNEWLEANNKTGISTELKNSLVKSYNEETTDIFDFNKVETLKDSLQNNFEEFYESIDDNEEYDYMCSKGGLYCANYETIKEDWINQHKASMTDNYTNGTNILIDGDTSYKAISPSRFNYTSNSGYSGDLDKMVTYQLDGLKETAGIYQNNSEAINAVSNKTVSYMISEYGTEFFAGFHRTDDYSLTGADFGSSKMGEPYLFTQGAYLLFGDSSAKKNERYIMNIVYYSQYISKLIKNYTAYDRFTGYMYPNDYAIDRYYRDDILMLEDAEEQARNDYESIILYWGAANLCYLDDHPCSTSRYTYAHYMKVLMILQATTNENILLQRMRYVIEQDVSSMSGHEFSFSNAYTAVTINAKVKSQGIIGEGATFDYNTFAMY